MRLRCVCPIDDDDDNVPKTVQEKKTKKHANKSTIADITTHFHLFLLPVASPQLLIKF